jgi:ribosomal protein L15
VPRGAGSGSAGESAPVPARRRRADTRARRREAGVRYLKNPFRKDFVVVNVSQLQQAVDRGKLDPAAAIDEAGLKAAGLFKRRRDGVRLLAKGALTAKLTLTLTAASKAAVAAVEKAGGTIVLTGAATGGGEAALTASGNDGATAGKPAKGNT